MRTISCNNNLFCGSVTNRSLRHNIPGLTKKTFMYLGQMIVVVHGGPAPAFISQEIADYIVHGIASVKPFICSVPDSTIQQKLSKVWHVLLCACQVLTFGAHIYCCYLFEFTAWQCCFNWRVWIIAGFRGIRFSIWLCCLSTCQIVINWWQV